ncbi:MAG: protein kinase, partial [Polyangiaceae bacterium]
EVPDAAPRFLREARSAVAIQSEHVARVLDVGTLDDGAPYMVMEYLTGSDLRDVLQRDGKLSIPAAIDYVLQAGEAIAEAHALGIAHRDLKPDNVFVTHRADGSALVKVLDFGLSKPTRDERLGPSAPSLTAQNMVAGSPQYMSPEQVRSLKSTDHRTDVWALGVILFELLTGQRPFEADTVAAIFAKIAADPPTRPRTLRPDLPPALEQAILRCLEKDLARRTQDVAELARALEPFAPPESRTSVDRILRIGGARVPPSTASSPGANSKSPSTNAGSGSPSASSSGVNANSPGSDALRAVDPLEADIPTMAAPLGSTPQPFSPSAQPFSSSAQPFSPSAQPFSSSAQPFSPSAQPLSPSAQPAPSSPQMHAPVMTSMSARGADHATPPVRRPMSRVLDDAPDLDLNIAAPPTHPTDRGRIAARARAERQADTQLRDLRLGDPIRVLGVAVLIAIADMASARMLGQQITIGPVRLLWIAGPLAGIGALWMIVRIVRR